MIATNTISQGDTRASGLGKIAAAGDIYCAFRRVPWPGQAAVIVSQVFIRRGGFKGNRQLDGRVVQNISAFLFHSGGSQEPERLMSNARKSFKGAFLLGHGFIFDDADPAASPIARMNQILAASPRSAEVIVPYVGGEEVNDHPAHLHRRYAIDLGPMSLAEAARFPDVLGVLREKVLPERIGKPGGYSKYWWQHGRRSDEAKNACRSLSRVLVISRVGGHCLFTFVGAGVLCSESLIVFPFQEVSALGVLQSRIHEVWARFFGSSMKDDLRYTPSDCFETFPFPRNWTTDPTLEAAGQAYYEFRAALMVRNNEGLTKTYNRFHDPDETDPDIIELRRLHAKMDRAVLNAYGWTDIPTDCVFRLDYEEPEDDDAEETGKKRRKKKPWRLRWPEAVHDEVLARLLALNQERAEEERKLAGPKERNKAAARMPSQPSRAAGGRPAPAPKRNPSLFGGDE